jgi:ABC-type antimicrobial peptide transport system permease subunit
MGYSSIMYPFLEIMDYIQVVILVLLTGIISSIFPTIRAIKMKPAEAVRD